jgi:hypothetical protein
MAFKHLDVWRVAVFWWLGTGKVYWWSLFMILSVPLCNFCIVGALFELYKGGDPPGPLYSEKVGIEFAFPPRNPRETQKSMIRAEYSGHK